MAATERHQELVLFLVELLRPFVRTLRLGRVLAGPYAMRASADGPAREPDVFFISAEHRDRIQPAHLVGPADLVVEVISDDSVGRDRGDKFYEYQDAGVREYWLIDPRGKLPRADFYVLDADGRYQPAPVNAGRYASTVLPGFWLRLDWLWEAEPDAHARLGEILGAERVLPASSIE